MGVLISWLVLCFTYLRKYEHLFIHVYPNPDVILWETTSGNRNSMNIWFSDGSQKVMSTVHIRIGIEKIWKNSILLSLHCMKAQWDSLDSRFYWPPCDSFQQALAVKLLLVCCAIPPCAKWHSQVRSSGSTLNPAMSGCKQFQVPDVNLSEECKS